MPEHLVLESKVLQLHLIIFLSIGTPQNMFLQKISKSKGNGLSVEEWLRYGTAESLSLFMYNQPKRAKRLFFDVIPKMVDEYFSHLEKFHAADAANRYDNPAWHIHDGNPPTDTSPISIISLT